MSPKKFKPQSIVSPSPKDLKPRKSSVSRRIIIWGLVASIGLVMVACLLDYQQGKLANHTSRLPHEVQVATKYLVDMASEVPHKMDIFYDGAKGQVIILTGKMYIGDKTVAQMLFGVTDKEDPIPKDVKVDFELEDEIEELIEEGNTLDDLKKVEEVAIKLRKEEELRLYEEKKQQLKEEAMILMEAEKKAAMEALLEEKAKLRAKIEAETAAMKLKELDDKKLAEMVKAEIAASAEALKTKLAAQAAAASQLVLEKQKEEMARLSEKLNKKLETSKLEAEEVKESYKDVKKLEPKQQVSEEPKKEAEDVKETYKDESKAEPKQKVSEDTNKEAEEVKETFKDEKKTEPKQQVIEDTKEDSSKKDYEEDEAE